MTQEVTNMLVVLPHSYCKHCLFLFLFIRKTQFTQLYATSIVLMLLLLCVLTASLLTMLSHSQHYARHAGEALTLSCDFQAVYFNLFDNPILWRKMQRDEKTQVNIQGNINIPFVETHRFRVSFYPMPPSYRFELTIKRKYILLYRCTLVTRIN